jgi:hypothetical protein
MRIVGLLLLAFQLIGCESSRNVGAQRATANSAAQWLAHPKTGVTDVFGNSAKNAERRFVSHGYYEQRGTEISNTSWEGVAHYSYLVRRGICIGRIENADFSISPTGRYAAITSNNGRALKLYDSRTNRYFIRSLPPAAIVGYHWLEKDCTLQLDLTHKPGALRIMFPLTTASANRSG